HRNIGSNELPEVHAPPFVIERPHHCARMIGWIDDAAQKLERAGDGLVERIRDQVDLPATLFGAQMAQGRQILLEHARENAYVARVGDLEQIVRGIHDLAEVEVLLENLTLDGRAQLGVGPAFFDAQFARTARRLAILVTGSWLLLLEPLGFAIDKLDIL